MERVNWLEHRTSEEILQMVYERKPLIESIRSWQRKWMGPIMRGNFLLRTIIKGSMDGKRTRRRPRVMRPGLDDERRLQRTAVEG